MSTLKKVFNILGYVVIVSQIFSVKIPILSQSIFGYSIKYLLFYFFIATSIGKWLVSIIRKGKIKYDDVFLINFMFFPYFVGIFFGGWGLSNVLIESVLFMMPVAVYLWVQTGNLKQDAFIIIFQGTVIIGAVVAVLVALRLVETNIWAAEGELVRAAGAVDSDLFMGGFILSYVMLFVFPKKEKLYRKMLCLLAFAGSIIGLLFTQSRTRLGIAVIFVVAMLIFNIFNKRSKYGNVRVVLVTIIGIYLILRYVPSIFNQIIEQIQGRFNVVDDQNIIYREKESLIQLQGFLSSPVVGLGWGSRSQYRRMYVHNLYTTLLMQCGLLFGGCFIIWWCGFIKRNLLSIKRLGINRDNSVCLFILLLSSALGFTNAGIVQSGSYFTLMYVFICDKQKYRQKGDYRI